MARHTGRDRPRYSEVREREKCGFAGVLQVEHQLRRTSEGGVLYAAQDRRLTVANWIGDIEHTGAHSE